MSMVECMPRDVVRRRYPRLIERLMIANNLGRGEAVSCIQCHQLGLTIGGWNVNHAGGVLLCLRHAIRVRGLARSRVVRALFEKGGGA